MTAMQKMTARAARRYSALELTELFFVFSVIGWVWEVALHVVFDGELVNRGTMFGPWLPIYGTGGVLSVVLLRRIAHRPAAAFCAAAVLCSVLEYGTSWYLERVYGLRWWDYSMYPLNLDGRICLQTAVVFGLGCCAALYLVAPAVAERLARLPRVPQPRVCAMVLLLFALDFGWSTVNPNAGVGVSDYPLSQSVRAEGQLTELDPPHAVALLQNVRK